jgi:hypothetical protein
MIFGLKINHLATLIDAVSVVRLKNWRPKFTAPGTDVIIFKIIWPKMPFLTQNAANLCNHMYLALGYGEKCLFRRKSQK